jgi:type II secretory pathway component PulL
MFSMLLVISVFTAAGMWHYKRTKDEMREQVRGILAEYMPLEDNEGVMNGGSKMQGFQMPYSHDGGQTTSLIS